MDEYMDVREKLVHLLKDIMPLFTFEEQVDYLIDHGVTVQEWISVDYRLPEPKEKAICLSRDGEMMIGIYTEWGWMFPCYFEEPTHWMPLPSTEGLK